MKEPDFILENQIKYLETLLETYNRIAERSGRSWSEREETVNRILDRLQELYRLRNWETEEPTANVIKGGGRLLSEKQSKIEQNI